MITKRILLLISITSIFASCKKDETIYTPSTFNTVSGVYISSEGNFQSANSNICYYNPVNNYFVENVYENVNAEKLGDVCQSMSYINGLLYLVVNNSGKIEVCNIKTMKKSHTITGLTSPRFIYKVDSLKAYVSDLFSNQISIVNLTDGSITGSITVNGWTEQMLKVSNLVYVTNVSSEYISIINPIADTIADSIHITKGASSLSLDMNGKLWVLCGGDYMGTYTAALHRIDLSTKTIEQTLTFNTTDFPSHLCMNVAKDSLYFINNNIYKMSIAETSFPSTAFLQSSSNSFYSLKVEPTSGDVYISDAIDYIQKGVVYRYSANGALKTSLRAGIVPGDFLFY